METISASKTRWSGQKAQSGGRKYLAFLIGKLGRLFTATLKQV